MLMKASFVALTVCVMGCTSPSAQGPAGAQGPVGPAEATSGTGTATGAGTGSAAAAGAQGAAAPSAANAIGNSPALDLTMQGTITVGGIQVCSGTFEMTLNINPSPGSPQTIDFPDSSDNLSCILAGNISLHDLIDGKPGAPKPPAPPSPFIKNQGAVEAISGIGGYVFTPYRPFIPSFLTASPSQLQAINLSVPVTATSQTSGETASGTVSVRTLQYQPTYQDAAMSRSFNDVYTIEFDDTGYDAINALAAVLFDKMVWQIGLNPLAFLHFELDTTVSSAMQAALASPATGTGTASVTGTDTATGGGILSTIGGVVAGAANALVGSLQVQIVLDTVAQKGLPPPGQTPSAGGDGEVIGGKATGD